MPHQDDLESSFEGREWALERIAGWLSSDEPVLVLIASLGWGKTALARCLARVGLLGESGRSAAGDGWLSAAHFCRNDDYESIDPCAVLGKVAARLADVDPEYAECLLNDRPGGTTVSIQQTVTSSSQVRMTGIKRLSLGEQGPRRAFDQLLRKPMALLSSRHPARRHVVLIDGLDESIGRGIGFSLAELLAQELKRPVDGLRFILMTRPGSAWPVPGAAVIDLGAEHDLAVRDVSHCCPVSGKSALTQ